MTEHEQFTKLCEIIGYEIDMKWLIWDKWIIFIDVNIWQIPIDVRTDIFSPKFIEKMNEYFLNTIPVNKYTEEEIILKVNEYLLWYFAHLDNPVSYLYKFIK